MTNARLGVYIVKEARRDHRMEIFMSVQLGNTRILENLMFRN